MPITVNFPAMLEAVANVRATHSSLVGQHADMDQFLNKLRGTWHGGAGSNWQLTQHHYNGAAEEVHTILLNLHNALEMAHSNYTRTERALEQIWGR
jgi:WXG100 family type VII secretion target